jgi:hypothetical protein
MTCYLSPSCRKELNRLIDECGSEEMARFLYKNVKTKWIEYKKIRNIEYLAKGGFGKVYKATWERTNVALKQLYNSGNKIFDLLNEVGESLILLILIDFLK